MIQIHRKEGVVIETLCVYMSVCVCESVCGMFQCVFSVCVCVCERVCVCVSPMAGNKGLVQRSQYVSRHF